MTNDSNSDQDRDDAQHENIPHEQYEHLSRAMDELAKVDEKQLPNEVAVDVENTYGRFDKYYNLVEDDPEVATDGGQTVEQSTYQVTVWAKKEFDARVQADDVDEAKDEAREFVQFEHGVDSRDISSVNYETELDDGRHLLTVWGKNEWVVRVDAEDEEAAEDAARERVQFEHGVQTRDISSVNVEAEL